MDTKPQATIGLLKQIICYSFFVYHFLFVGGIFQYFGFYLSTTVYRAGSLLFFLLLSFVFAKKNRWYSVLLITPGILALGFFLLFGDHIFDLYGIGKFPIYGQVLFIAIIVSLFEAARRLLGLVIPIIAVTFMCLPVFQDKLPGILHGGKLDPLSISATLFLDNYGIMGDILGVASTIIVAFVIFGGFIAVSGTGEFFTKVALALFGRYRGGPAKATIVSSSLFGMVSGSPTANIGSVGSFTIPMMKRLGFSPEFAAAIEAVAANGGQIMPPVMGMVAFIMSQVTDIPYGTIALAAFLPAILYYTAVYSQLHFEALKLGLTGMPKEQRTSVLPVLKEAWFLLIPLLILIYSLFISKYSAERSAFYATLSLIFIMLIQPLVTKEKFSLGKFLKAIESGASTMVMPGLMCAIAGVLVSSMNLSGFAIRLCGGLIELSHGSTFFLLVLAAVMCYIMGMGVTSIVSYIVVAATIAPALVNFGLPKLAVHFFVFYYAISSFITPPVAVNVYVAAGIAQAKPMLTGYKAMKLAIVAYLVPFTFVYSPSLLLLEGMSFYTLVVFIFALLGTISLSAGIEKYCFAELSYFECVLFLVGGILMFWPDLFTTFIGIPIAGGGLILNWRRFKRVAKTPNMMSPV